MTTLELKPYNGALSLIIPAGYDQAIARLAGAGNVGLNAFACPRLVLLGNAGSAPIDLLVNGLPDWSGATFEGGDATLSGAAGGARLTLKGGWNNLNLSGLSGLTELESATDNFPNSVLLINFGLTRLIVHASTFQGTPGAFGFSHSSSALPESDQGDFLDLCCEFLDDGGDVSALQVDFSGGANAALGAYNLAKVATLVAAGASILHR